MSGIKFRDFKRGKTKQYNKLVTFVLIDRISGKRTPMKAFVCPEEWTWLSQGGAVIKDEKT